MGKADRGFASMNPAKQREIASKGGKAAHQKGTAHEWTREEAREAGRKGGMVAHRRKPEPGSVERQSTEHRIAESGRAAFLVVDVQVDFCPGGALPVPDGDRVVPVLNRYLADAVERGMSVYASRDWHPSVTSHFKPYGGEWPPHCVQHTPGARFHPELRLPPSSIVMSKGDDPERPGYSAFEGRTPDGRPLLDDLRERGIERLYVGGLATDYCVRASVLDARRAGLGVTVLRDAVAGIDVHPGDSERAIAGMREAGAAIATLADRPLAAPALARASDT